MDKFSFKQTVSNAYENNRLDNLNKSLENVKENGGFEENLFEKIDYDSINETKQDMMERTSLSFEQASEMMTGGKVDDEKLNAQIDAIVNLLDSDGNGKISKKELNMLAALNNDNNANDVTSEDFEVMFDKLKGGNIDAMLRYTEKYQFEREHHYNLSDSEQKALNSAAIQKDDSGNITNITDGINDIGFEYNDKGEVTSVKHNGTVYSGENLDYDSSKGMLTVKDDDGNTVMTRRTNSVGSLEIVNYENGKKDSKLRIGANSITSYATYNDEGTAVIGRVFVPSGKAHEYERNENGKLLSVLKYDSEGNFSEKVQINTDNADNTQKTDKIENIAENVQIPEEETPAETEVDTKDGNISYTKQNTTKGKSTGDCWLLSGINALSYSEKGREIIQNALEYGDEETTVKFAGYGNITVSDDELQAAKESGRYASGDDDMVIFELAFEKIRNEIATGEAAVNPNFINLIGDIFLFDASSDEKLSIDSGYGIEVAALLTGKKGENISNETQIRNQLKDFEKNGNKDKSIVISKGGVSLATKVTDVDRNELQIVGSHGYAVKEVKNGIVTITNPWDSSEEIKIDTDTFLKVFKEINVVDLSDSTPVQNVISSNYTTDADGYNVYEFSDSDYSYKIKSDSSGNIEKEIYASGKLETVQSKYKNSDGKRVFEQKCYDDSGKITFHDKYTYTNPISRTVYTYQYDARGNIIGKTENEYTKSPFTGQWNPYKDGEVIL